MRFLLRLFVILLVFGETQAIVSRDPGGRSRQVVYLPNFQNADKSCYIFHLAWVIDTLIAARPHRQPADPIIYAHKATRHPYAGLEFFPEDLLRNMKRVLVFGCDDTRVWENMTDSFGRSIGPLNNSPNPRETFWLPDDEVFSDGYFAILCPLYFHTVKVNLPRYLTTDALGRRSSGFCEPDFGYEWGIDINALRVIGSKCMTFVIFTLVAVMSWIISIQELKNQLEREARMTMSETGGPTYTFTFADEWRWPATLHHGKEYKACLHVPGAHSSSEIVIKSYIGAKKQS